MEYGGVHVELDYGTIIGSALHTHKGVASCLLGE